MMAWKKNKPSSLLSMEWGYAQLHFEWVKKTVASLIAWLGEAWPFQRILSRNPPEIIARAIRQALDQAQVTEKHCIVSLPVGWLFSCRTELPELEQEDLQSFLDTQAEREFPFAFKRSADCAGAPSKTISRYPTVFRMALPTSASIC